LLQPTGPPSRFSKFFAQQATRRLSVFVELNRCAMVGRRASAAGFAKHFDLSPEQLGSEDIRSYQLHLIHQKASWSRINQVVCALRFLYATTLCRAEQMPRIPCGKKPKSLPSVLSTEEVASLLTAPRYRPAPPPPRLQRAESSKFTHSICRRGS
jgi:site-specific recombinase XerD